jgi:PleD family two-component response regulator
LGFFALEIETKSSDFWAVTIAHIDLEKSDIILGAEHSRKLMDVNVRLSEQTNVNKLTQLYNRRFFDIRMMEKTSNAARHKKDLSLILIDSDNFKTYTSYGE